MKQTITLILAVYVIVYVCITIYNKPNLEFFYATNDLNPPAPKHVRADYQNNGLKVGWAHPQPFQNVIHYEIHIKDIRNEFNTIPIKVITEGMNSSNPTTIVRDSGIVGNNQYKVSMKAVGKDGKSNFSNTVLVSTSNTSSENISLSDNTIKSLDMETQRFKEQEAEQNIQNKAIANLKKRVDNLRNDIVILKNKEKEEYRSVYNRVGMDDSISQLPNSVKDRLGLGLPSEIDINFTIDPTL